MYNTPKYVLPFLAWKVMRAMVNWSYHMTQGAIKKFNPFM